MKNVMILTLVDVLFFALNYVFAIDYRTDLCYIFITKTHYVLSLSSCNSIKTFDFSTLYTSIPHSKLKDKLKELVLLCFIKKEWPTKIQVSCLGKG